MIHGGAERTRENGEHYRMQIIASKISNYIAQNTDLQDSLD